MVEHFGSSPDSISSSTCMSSRSVQPAALGEAQLRFGECAMPRPLSTTEGCRKIQILAEAFLAPYGGVGAFFFRFFME